MHTHAHHWGFDRNHERESVLPNSTDWLEQQRLGALHPQDIRNVRQYEQTSSEPTSDSLPFVSFNEKTPHVLPHDVVINGSNGRSDVVAGIQPQAGESLSSLVRRLHPDLPPEQVPREVSKLIKYNNDYGNPIGDPNHLDANQTIYLTSAKITDAQGRIRRIESPTGQTTDIAYDGNAVAGYKISDGNGQLVEQGDRLPNGSYQIARGGQVGLAQNVQIDDLGNITSTDSSGYKWTHLTRGDDIITSYQNELPVESTAMRHGHVTTNYRYHYDHDGVKVYARYAANPSQEVLLTPDQSPDDLERAQEGLGQGRNGNNGDSANRPDTVTADSGDITGDNFVASRIVQQAYAFLGKHSYDFNPAVPTTRGCAEFVSNTLHAAGFDGSIIDASCSSLVSKLQSHHFVRVSTSHLQPGDIVFGASPGGHMHTGIYIGNGKVIANSSSRGYAREDSYSRVFNSFSERFAYRYVDS